MAQTRAQTIVNVSNTTLQKGMKRVGINLGGHNYYDQPILKNLAMTNPGFSPTLYRSIIGCVSGSTTSCTDQAFYSGQITGFWPNGAAISVLYGPAAGCSTTVSSYYGPSGGAGGTFYFAAPCSAAIDNTTWLLVSTTIGPGNANNNGTTLAGWWTKTGGGGSVTLESSDIPVSSSVQAADVFAPSSSAWAALTQYFDTESTGRSFLNLSGTFQIQFKAKARGGSGVVSVNLKRASASSPYYSGSTTLTNSWAQYNLSFTAAETGQQSGSVELDFGTNWTADEFLIDDVQVIQTGTSPSNSTVFRDEVLTTLQNLKPGVIRFWANQETDTLDNMLVDQFGRGPSNYSTYPSNSGTAIYSYNISSYSIPDFLNLVEQVGGGAEAWIVVPASFSTAEASNLIDYLSGTTNSSCTSGPAYARKRCAEGFLLPWTQAIPKIHLELGNEQWNGAFVGGSFAQYGGSGNAYGPQAYGTVAQTVFAAMKANPNYDSAHTALTVGAQFAASGAASLQVIQANCNNNDEVALAPYLADQPTDYSSIANIWQPYLAEPYAFWTVGAASGSSSTVCAEYFAGVLCPSGAFLTVGKVANSVVYGGGMYVEQVAEANSARTVPITIYEENNHTIQGSYTQAELNAFTSAWGAGLAQASQFLTNMANGVVTQNLFQLDQFDVVDYAISGYPTSNVWGAVIDMGGPTSTANPPHNLRPAYLVEQAVNAAITPGGTLLQTTVQAALGGSVPTFNVGNPASSTTVNTVAINNVPAIQAFAFTTGSGAYSLILLNLDTNTSGSGSHSVGFSGANAPTGAVTVSVLKSANLSDTNETSAVIAPASGSYSNPMTLAPYSMYVLTWHR